MRIERCCAETPAEDLIRYFSPQELADSGDGPGRAASLAARFAAKEACAKLFPRELALAEIEPSDFSIERDAYGAPQVACSARAELVLGRQRLRAIAVSLTHDRSASAVALAQADAPLAGDDLSPVSAPACAWKTPPCSGRQSPKPRSSAWRRRIRAQGGSPASCPFSLAVGGTWR